jgi:hypothetical protein
MSADDADTLEIDDGLRRLQEKKQRQEEQRQREEATWIAKEEAARKAEVE